LKSTSVTGEEEEYTPTQNGFLKNDFFPESTPFSVKDIHIQSVFDSMPHFHFETVVEFSGYSYLNYWMVSFRVSLGVQSFYLTPASTHISPPFEAMEFHFSVISRFPTGYGAC
jgi:hypothetical protein